MICELIMIGAVAINPCNIEKLEVSVLRPDSNCIIVDHRGERENALMGCKEVMKIMNSRKPEKAEARGVEWEI